jgi:hypothetical protein
MRKNSFLNSDSLKLHDSLIKSVALRLEREGYKVTANHINHPNGHPRPINGFVPDIHAIKNLEEIIVEVETCNTVISSDIIKWKRFSFNNCKFWIIVPESCLKIVKVKKEAFNIPVEIFCSDLNQGYKLETDLDNKLNSK